jgi:hypothetical protein
MLQLQKKEVKMASGDSHTGFDAQAFGIGAIGGAATIAAAMVAGIQNAAAANFHRWDREALVTGLHCSELMRQRLYRHLQATNRKVLDLRNEVIALRAELKAERARRLCK